MKRAIVFSFAVLAFAFAVSSCSKQSQPGSDPEDHGQENPDYIDFNVSASMEEFGEDADEETKTFLKAGDGTAGKDRHILTRWASGDCVDFFSPQSSGSVTKKSVQAASVGTSEQDVTAKFSVHIPKSSTNWYYAVYPSGNGSVSNAGVFSLTVPATQRPVSVRSGVESFVFDPNAAVMYSKLQSTNPATPQMPFRQLCSFVRINLKNPSKWKKIEISSRTAGQALAGNVTVASDGYITLPQSGAGEQYVTVQPKAGETNFSYLGANPVIMVAVFARNYPDGLRITFYSDTEGTRIRGIKAINLGRSENMNKVMYFNPGNYCDDLTSSGFKAPYVNVNYTVYGLKSNDAYSEYNGDAGYSYSCNPLPADCERVKFEVTATNCTNVKMANGGGTTLFYSYKEEASGSLNGTFTFPSESNFGNSRHGYIKFTSRESGSANMNIYCKSNKEKNYPTTSVTQIEVTKPEFVLDLSGEFTDDAGNKTITYSGKPNWIMASKGGTTSYKLTYGGAGIGNPDKNIGLKNGEGWINMPDLSSGNDKYGVTRVRVSVYQDHDTWKQGKLNFYQSGGTTCISQNGENDTWEITPTGAAQTLISKLFEIKLYSGTPRLGSNVYLYNKDAAVESKHGILINRLRIYYKLR